MLEPYSSGMTKAMAPVAEKYKIPMVEANGASRSLFNQGYRYLFAVLSTSEQYLKSAIDLAAAQAKKGLVKEAKKTEVLAIEATDAIGSTLSQVWMLSDLASENIQAGQIDRAANAFNRGIAIAESIENAWGRARALAKMAATLYEFR